MPQKLSKIVVWAELIRVHSAFGAALAVWVGGRLADATWQIWWLMPMAVAFLLSAAGNAFNDAHDVAIDRINRPKRPIPRAALTPLEARQLAYGCAVLAFGLALPFGTGSVLGTLVGIMLLFSYTTHLKSIPLLGNAVVGLLAGMAMGYGGLLGGKVMAILLPAATFGLLFGAREVLKTIHDVDGDGTNGLQTIATLAGNRVALLIATCCMLVALLLFMIWVTANPNGWLTWWLMLLMSLLILIPLWVAPNNPQVISWALACSKVIGLLLLFALSVI